MNKSQRSVFLLLNIFTIIFLLLLNIFEKATLSFIINIILYLIILLILCIAAVVISKNKEDYYDENY